MKENNRPINLTRVFDILEYQEQRYAQTRAFNYYENNTWEPTSIVKLKSWSVSLAAWLLEQGLEKEDKIAFIPQLGRPEWIALDFACQQIGVISVPIHPVSTIEEILFILKETEARLCIVADMGIYHQISSSSQELGFAISFYHLDRHSPGYLTALTYQKPSSEDAEKIERYCEQVSENDLVTIMYTSGTSGRPKGVMLTHKNLLTNLLFTLAVFPLEHSQKVLSFLPFSHIFERSACYSYIAAGVSIYFSRSQETVLQDFQQVQPSFCTTVPRILEKMHDFLLAKRMESGWLKRKIIDWALAVALSSNTSGRNSRKLNLNLALARWLVISRWRKLLGGRMKSMVVGAAALRPEIGNLLSAAKIQIREGYGMTETSPVISINRFDPGLNRFGTVGIPIPGMQLKIDKATNEETGEILVKGPNVTQGYYKQPILTRKSFTSDGWFKTGDVGQLIEGRFLKITDRKKDIFKTSAGKYIAPLPLENALVCSSYIQQCLIIGFNRSFVTALIVPNFNILKQWSLEENIHWTAPQYMVHNIKVRAKLQDEVDALNETLPNFKRIKDFVLCFDEWSKENGELTHTLKPKRQVLLEQFKKEIEKMY